MLRPHVSGYFLIRYFFFPDTAIVHTHTANSQANPEIFERVDIFESDNISDTFGRSNPDIFWYDIVTKLAPVFTRKSTHSRRSKANSFCAPWAYFQSFSLYAAKCRSTECWNKLCQNVAWHLQALYVNGRPKQLKRVGKQCRPRRFWVRPGLTSSWWDNFVNPQWLRSEYLKLPRFEPGTNSLDPWIVVIPFVVKALSLGRIWSWGVDVGLGARCLVETVVSLPSG